MINKVLVDSFIIDSKDKDATSSSTTDFRIKVPFSSIPIKTVELVKVAIPLDYNNITSVNQSVTVGGTGYTVPVGFYSINGLISALDTLTTGAGYNWTLTDGNRVNVNNGGGANFVLIPGVLSDSIGFVSTGTYTGTNTYTGTLLPDLTFIKYFTLHSSTIASKRKDHIYHSDSRSNTLAYIPLTEIHGSYQTWEPRRPIHIDVINQTLTSCDFQLKDQLNRSTDISGSIVLFFRRSV